MVYEPLSATTSYIRIIIKIRYPLNTELSELFDHGYSVTIQIWAGFRLIGFRLIGIMCQFLFFSYEL
jgi:hypothetical protein